MAALSLATVGGKVTAFLINQIVNVLTAGTAYVPTITNYASATIAPTVTGRWWRFGSVGLVMVQTKLGTGAITVGNMTISTPTAMDTTGMISDSTMLPSGVGMTDVSAGLFFDGGVRFVDANTVRVMRASSGTAGALLTINSTSPFTWATLDEMSVFFIIPLP